MTIHTHTVIIACARAGQVDAAVRFYDQARARGGDGKPGAPLNAMIYASAMYACSKVRVVFMVVGRIGVMYQNKYALTDLYSMYVRTRT